MNQTLASLLRRHLAAENACDLDGTLATLHPECRFEDCATGQTWLGHAGAAAHYRQWWTTFDVEVQRSAGQRSYWTEDDCYISETTWHGRHVGRFLGLAPSSQPIVQPFVVMITFRDGLMASERFHYDLASLLCRRSPDSIIDRLPDPPALSSLREMPTLASAVGDDTADDPLRSLVAQRGGIGGRPACRGGRRVAGPRSGCRARP